MIVTLAAPAARGQNMPDVLKKVPAGAPVVIAIPNLQAASGKIAMLNQQLNLGQPQMQNVLGMVRAMLGLEQGIRENGGLAFVMLTLPDPNEPGAEPLTAVVVPVTEYKAFLANFGEAQADANGITQINLGGEAAFAKASGQYAILSDSQEAVAAYKDEQPANIAQLAGQMSGGVITGSDMLVFVDMVKVGPVALPAVELGLMQAQQQMGEAERAIAEPVLKLYGDALKAVLNQAQSAVMGIDLSEQGIGMSFGAQFREGTALAQSFANAPKQNVSFNRLPAGPYMFAASVDMQALPIAKWVNQAIATLPADHPMAGVIKASLPTLAAQQVQQALYAPAAGGAAPTLFNGVNVYVTDKPAELVQAYRQSLDALAKAELGEGVSYQTQYNANVLQLDGKEVDQYTLKLNMPPEQMAELGPMAMFLGQAMTGYVTTTDNAMIVTNGADPALLRQAIAAAGGKGELNADQGIQNIAKQLPPHRAMEAYIGVGTIMQMVGNFAAMFAPEMQFNIPANLPPVATALSVNQGGMVYRYYVPNEVIKTITGLVQQFQGGGGAPGEPAPMPNNNNDAGAAAEPNPHVINVSDAQFEQKVLGAEGVVIVDFWAEWCGPCRSQAPILDKLAKQYGGKVTVAKVDVDTNQKTPEQYQVSSIPTLLVFQNGKVAKKFVGLTRQETLAAAIDPLLK
jgi:thioredoxin 1